MKTQLINLFLSHELFFILVGSAIVMSILMFIFIKVERLYYIKHYYLKLRRRGESYDQFIERYFNK